MYKQKKIDSFKELNFDYKLDLPFFFLCNNMRIYHNYNSYCCITLVLKVMF